MLAYLLAAQEKGQSAQARTAHETLLTELHSLRFAWVSSQTLLTELQLTDWSDNPCALACRLYYVIASGQNCGLQTLLTELQLTD